MVNANQYNILYQSNLKKEENKDHNAQHPADEPQSSQPCELCVNFVHFVLP